MREFVTRVAESSSRTWTRGATRGFLARRVREMALLGTRGAGRRQIYNADSATAFPIVARDEMVVMSSHRRAPEAELGPPTRHWKSTRNTCRYQEQFKVR